MTERLYYDDAYLWEFEGKVTSIKNGTRPGEWVITLDRSAFYPTSGGQPSAGPSEPGRPWRKTN